MITAERADLRIDRSPTSAVLRQLRRGQVLTVGDDSAWWKTTDGWLKKTDTSPPYALSRIAALEMSK
jgi:hypothetical protein